MLTLILLNCSCASFHRVGSRRIDISWPYSSRKVTCGSKRSIISRASAACFGVYFIEANRYYAWLLKHSVFEWPLLALDSHVIRSSSTHILGQNLIFEV